MTDHSILWKMGYRPIASEAHAEQLLRRQIKRMRADQQRHTPHSHSGCTAMSAEFLLLITPGKPAAAESPNPPGK